MADSGGISDGFGIIGASSFETKLGSVDGEGTTFQPRTVAPLLAVWEEGDDSLSPHIAELSNSSPFSWLTLMASGIIAASPAKNSRVMTAIIHRWFRLTQAKNPPT